MYYEEHELCLYIERKLYYNGCLQALETRIEACEDLAAKEKYNVIKVTAEVQISVNSSQRSYTCRIKVLSNYRTKT